MALSDWDTLAFDNDGNPCNGIIKSFDGETSVEAYKNWLYVRDKKMWKKDCPFTGDTIAKIENGSVHLSNFHIQAVRGPQDSVVAVITTTNWDEKTEVYSVRRMFVIAGDGYKDKTKQLAKALNVDLSKWDDWNEFSEFGCGEDKIGLFLYKYLKNGKAKTKSVSMDTNPKFDAKWTGITKSTLNWALNWLKKNFGGHYADKEEKEWITKIEKQAKQGSIRFNQGDAFFAHAFGKEIPATKVGKAKEPVAKAMIENLV